MKKIVITGILITLFSLILGFYNLHKAGRWTDENFYVEKGYIVVNLLKNGDFSNSYFYKEGSDHPLTAVYFYGLTSFLDLNKLENTHVSDNINIKKPIFNYDYTYSRLIPIFLSALTVLLTYLFCIRYLSFFVAVAAALILATLPHFVGFSQFVSLESWCIFTFTLAVIFSFLYFETKKTKFLVLTAIMSGITLTVKQSNILIYTFLFLFFLTQKFYFKDKIRFKNVLIFILVTVFTIFVTYPMPFFHLPDFLKSSHDLWFANGGKIPEVIFGRMMGAPIVYYFIAILITTPVLVLIFLFTGLFEILRKNRTWIYIGLILWFIVPFFMIFFTARQHMIRYIFQIYVPLSIIAAIGLDSFLKNFIKNESKKFLVLLLMLVYLLVILYKATPYYLTYYNELIGGTKNVYDKKLFLIGWYSEGQKAVGKYLEKNAKKGDWVGYAVDAGYSAIYDIDEIVKEKFDRNKRYDYVVVSYFNVIRNGFDEEILKHDYKLVFVEKANGIDLMRVYKRLD